MCPYSLYLQLVKGIESESGQYAEVGILLHQIIDLLSNNLITKTDAYRKFHSELILLNESGKVDEEMVQHFTQIGTDSLDFFELIKGNLSTEFLTEENVIFEVAEGLPKVSCTLDRIDVNNGEYRILDWKTGKPMSGKKLVEDLQPPLYIQAVKEKFGVYPKSFSLFYLAHKKIITYDLVDEIQGLYIVLTARNKYSLNVPEVVNGRVKEILTRINNNNFSAPKDTHSWYCKNMCQFGKEDKCNGSEKEQWKLLKELYGEGKSN
jgi:hypothetical protein